MNCGAVVSGTTSNRRREDCEIHHSSIFFYFDNLMTSKLVLVADIAIVPKQWSTTAKI